MNEWEFLLVLSIVDDKSARKTISGNFYLLAIYREECRAEAFVGQKNFAKIDRPKF